MRQRRGNLARSTIVAASSRAKQRVNSTLKLAEQLRTDPEKAARQKACLCKACYYFTQLTPSPTYRRRGIPYAA